MTDAVNDIPPEVIDDVERLRSELRHHAYLYYHEARPEIGDAEFDDLFRQLQALEAQYPALQSADSPTMRVGVPPQDKFETVEHVAPLLSLDSSEKSEDFVRFHDRVCRALGDGVTPRYILEPKLDGASIELVYEDGVLAREIGRAHV